MAAYDSLKSLVQQAIRTNGNNEITGQVLQNVLMAMIDELGGENGYAGVATPSTNPGATDGKVFYFATEAGTYTHFDGATLAKGIHLLVFNGVTWSHQTLYTIDSEVTSGSNNLITSGAVYTKIINAINALDATVSKSAGADGLSLSLTETDGKVTSISGSIAPQTYDAYGAASAAQISASTDATNKVNAAKMQILGDAASDYNTLGKLEDKIQAEASRAAAAESALNTDKAEKATTLAGYGINDAYTKTEVNGLVSTPHQNYVTVPTYASLPATGSADTIYRVSNYNGSTSQVDASVYSEYAWNGSGYTFLRVVSQIGEVFDITVYNSNTKYADLAAALGINGANVPSSIRRGGMSVKFVQSSDNKYVQYRLMSQTFSNSVSDWQEYINTEYKSYNYTKNDYTNSLIKEIHIEGTKDPNLKYFVRSCKRFYTSPTENAWMYFAIQSYNPSTEERVTICEMGSGELNKSGVFSKTQNGYKTTILVTIDNQNSNEGCVDTAPYSEDLEINDICWGNIENAPLIKLFSCLDIQLNNFQIIQDKIECGTFLEFITSIPVSKRNRPTIAVYRGKPYIFRLSEIRQYTNEEWLNETKWYSTENSPYSAEICKIPSVNLMLKDLRLTEGYLGSNYIYYLRGCRYTTQDNNKVLYVGMKAHNTTDDSEIIVFDNKLNAGYNKITKNGHTWECYVDLNVKIDSFYTKEVSYSEILDINTISDYCLSQSGHLLLDLYSNNILFNTRISSLENKTQEIEHDIWDDNKHTIKEQILYTLTAGFYNNSAQLQPDGSYKSPALISCRKGDILRFDNFWPNYTDTSMAFWIYDSEYNAIGSRINKNDLTPDENGSVYYKIDRDGAAYIGVSTNEPNPGNMYFVVRALQEGFIDSIKNDDGIGKVVDLIVFIGQSNMAGRGISNTTYPEVAPYVPEKYGREFRAISDPTKLYPIADPFGLNENNSDTKKLHDGNSKTGSLVPAFINSYYKVTGVPVIAVSASEGALNIEQFQPYDASAPEEDRKYKLQDAIERFQLCVQYLTAHNYTIRHKFAVWCQGENDSSRVATWESLFENVLNALLAAGAEKVLMIRIGRNSSNTAQDGIVNLQTQMAKTHKDIILISTGFAKYAGEGTMKDTQHFYQFAYNEVGRQAGHNAGCWANYQIERTQYDSMHKVDANIPELYISDKCY